MEYQSVFQRYELKYLLTPKQKAAILSAMEGRMELDHFGRSTVRSLYFDTENYRLIRRSLEKPVYKEKLRLRSYHPVTAEDEVFVELKKKYKSVVYKRRLALPEGQAMDWLCRGQEPGVTGQIRNEVDYFLYYYKSLRPAMYLSYQREAYDPVEDSGLRITFDEDILARQDGLSLREEPGGLPVLPPELTLMEIKTPGGLPLWLTHALTKNGIRKTSFSKYGTAYQTQIMNGGTFYVAKSVAGRV